MLPRTSQGRSYPPEGPRDLTGVSRPDTSAPASDYAVSWESLVCAWSPRPYVRVDPRREHSFSSTRRLVEDPPARGVPYALHLTDEAGRFRLLAFDFDAHLSGSSAESDLAACTSALTTAGVQHLVCSSGPGGGYHVWIRLARPVAAARLAPLIDAFAAAWPSLDRSPLSNSRTGCVRAPGSPHRMGGSSIPLGDVDIRPVPLPTLLGVLQHLPSVKAVTPTADAFATVLVHRDPYGQPYLDGPRRPLPQQIRALARSSVAPADDASSVGWSILLACAHARMQHQDLVKAAFTDCWPGLEFLRTRRSGSAREPRTDARAELERQWTRAVAAASLCAHRSSEPSPTRRRTEQRVVSLVNRMADQPTRWTGKTGVQDRLVLLALAVRMLAAASEQVQLSERDWAVATGLTREAVADRLPRLRQQGWIERVQRAVGPWAAVWECGAAGGGNSRSGSVFSSTLEGELVEELEYARADVWHRRELGVLGFRVWSLLREGSAPVGEVATRLGLCPATVRAKLRALRQVGLCTADGRAYWGRGRLERAARIAGVQGAHADRVRLYRLQSAVFVWWFTTRYQPDGSDALTEWGSFPTPEQAAAVHPVDIALAYGATARGTPVQATTWGAAMAAQDRHREMDPASWWELVAAARADLPAADVLAAPHQLASTAA